MRSRGEEFFRLSPGSKTEDVSEYKRRVVNGAAWNASLRQTLHHSRAIIRLTSNHMQGQLAVHLEQMGLAKAITVKCLYVPSYSPKLNLVEYVIHLLRLRFLHHLPMGTTLGQIEQQLEQFLESNQFLSAEQVQKTLNFIFSLVA